MEEYIDYLEGIVFTQKSIKDMLCCLVYVMSEDDKFYILQDALHEMGIEYKDYEEFEEEEDDYP